MLVFELPLKICILSPLPFLQAAEKIGRFIESALWEVGLYPPDDEASYAGWPYTLISRFPLNQGSSTRQEKYIRCGSGRSVRNWQNFLSEGFRFIKAKKCRD